LPVRILIADDNASVRAAVRRVLESEQREIIEAENGKEAVCKAEELRPDVVILDLVMPVMNGLRASWEIATMLPGTPIVMHTLYSTPEIDLEARKVGVRQIVPKSESATLVSVVEDILRTEHLVDKPSASMPVSSEAETMRRNEDKIRGLCAQLFAIENDAEHAKLLAELQHALHQHIERLRARVAEYPLVVERRVHKNIPTSGAPDNAAQQERTPASNVTPIAERLQETPDEDRDQERAAG
jgi:DNA-binding NarL/FixJ family response regulator